RSAGLRAGGRGAAGRCADRAASPGERTTGARPADARTGLRHRRGAAHSAGPRPGTGRLTTARAAVRGDLVDQPEKATTPTPELSVPPGTPLHWRYGIGLVVLALAGLAHLLYPWIGSRGQSALGVLAFLGLAAAFS